MSKLISRMNKDDYKHWIRVCQSFCIMCTALEPLIVNEMNTFHNDLRRLLGSNTCNSNCKAYKSKAPSECSVCLPWKEKLIEEHTAPSNIEWENVDTKKWPESPFEVAKIFMPKGKKKVATYSETDPSGLLNLVINCNRFGKLLNQKKALKIANIRNIAMHSRKMEFSPQDMKDYINIIVTFLQDPDHEELLNDKDAQNAVTEIKKIRNMHIEICDEDVIAIFRDKYNCLKNEMDIVKDKIPDELPEKLEIFQQFIHEHEDLKEVFAKEMSFLMKKIDCLYKKVHKVERKADEAHRNADEANRKVNEIKSNLQAGIQVTHTYGKYSHTVVTTNGGAISSGDSGAAIQHSEAALLPTVHSTHSHDSQMVNGAEASNIDFTAESPESMLDCNSISNGNNDNGELVHHIDVKVNVHVRRRRESMEKLQQLQQEVDVLEMEKQLALLNLQDDMERIQLAAQARKEEAAVASKERKLKMMKCEMEIECLQDIEELTKKMEADIIEGKQNEVFNKLFELKNAKLTSITPACIRFTLQFTSLEDVEKFKADCQSGEIEKMLTDIIITPDFRESCNKAGVDACLHVAAFDSEEIGKKVASSDNSDLEHHIDVELESLMKAKKELQLEVDALKVQDEKELIQGAAQTRKKKKVPTATLR